MVTDKNAIERERSRLAMARLNRRRQEAGLKKITFWATPEVQELLSKMKGSHSSYDDLLNAIVRRHRHGFSDSLHDSESRGDSGN